MSIPIDGKFFLFLLINLWIIDNIGAKIFDSEICALFDSGSNSSIIGGDGLQLLDDLNLVIQPCVG